MTEKKECLPTRHEWNRPLVESDTTCLVCGRKRVEIEGEMMSIVGLALDNTPDVCPGCWRDLPLTPLPKTELELCEQCHAQITTLLQYGDGSESAAHARRLTGAWEKQSERRRAYARERLERAGVS